MNALAIQKKDSPRLIKYDAMCTAIEIARSVDEAKDLRDKALALAAYARQALNRDNERLCCEIRVRAERRTGELLRETANNGTRASKERGRPGKVSNAATLTDHGISRDQSSDWQKLAAIPEKTFEKELRKPGIPSTHQILANVNPKPPQKSPVENVDPDALQVWGAILDFERRGILKRKPSELFETMTPSMRKEIARLIPRVIAWLHLLEKAK